MDAVPMEADQAATLDLITTERRRYVDAELAALGAQLAPVQAQLDTDTAPRPEGAAPLPSPAVQAVRRPDLSTCDKKTYRK